MKGDIERWLASAGDAGVPGALGAVMHRLFASEGRRAATACHPPLRGRGDEATPGTGSMSERVIGSRRRPERAVRQPILPRGQGSVRSRHRCPRRPSVDPPSAKADASCRRCPPPPMSRAARGERGKDQNGRATRHRAPALSRCEARPTRARPAHGGHRMRGGAPSTTAAIIAVALFCAFFSTTVTYVAIRTTRAPAAPPTEAKATTRAPARSSSTRRDTHGSHGTPCRRGTCSDHTSAVRPSHAARAVTSRPPAPRENT